jgi:dolichol-phosphate mannosyltransferase
MPGEVWLIVPTYNEVHNIRRVVTSAAEALHDAVGDRYRILIVDDASPDGTGDVAEELAAVSARIQVLHRRVKAGLGRAYVAGFDLALSHGASQVIEMDGDLSHDPADLSRLIDCVRSGADLALGSRYVAGGRIDGWTRRRRLLSRAGCLYARLLLGVPVHDLTGGYKCFNAETLQAIDYRRMRSQGYSFQIEMTYRTMTLGGRVVEVPITFRERESGMSKMSARIALEAALVVPALGAARAWRARQAKVEPVGRSLPDDVPMDV